MNHLKKCMENKKGFFLLAGVVFWIKTLLIYGIEFELGVNGIYQTLILLINPLAFIILFFSIALFFSKGKRPYRVLLFVYFLMSLLLYANVLYYREFTDFITLSTITGNMIGGGNFSLGLINSFLVLLKPWDIFYWIDFLILGFAVLWDRFPVVLDQQPTQKRYAFLVFMSGLIAFAANLGLAEIDRPQLLTRTFDRNYIVKYLGLNFYQGYDAFQTMKNNKIRASADENDLAAALNYAKDVRAAPNEEYFGIAKGRNVITIVLESAQQFAMDYHLEDENGEKHEVTPFLNQIYHDPATLSFSNFYHQTGQGKSSDAEILTENSLFGLPEGAAFQTVGSTNTFYAAPNIMKAEADYTTAAFHGNVGSFWNRTDTYKTFGYDFFFDASFYDMSKDRTVEYGLIDKVFLHDSVKYLEQLPQPFYSKFLLLTNHFPYPLDEKNASIPPANTDDKTINQYFVTMRYTDEAVQEFMEWTKATGLYDNSIFVFYGDHYGISNMRNPELTKLLGIEENWTNYHNTKMQRVPLMFHIPGYQGGKIIDKIGGQVDFLPTLMHLLGMKTDSYLFMGQDLLSEENDEQVIFRNGHMVTKDLIIAGSELYDAKTGELLNDTLSEGQLNKIHDQQKALTQKLKISDQMISMDLLRFYTPKTFTDIEKKHYQYSNQLSYLRSHPKSATSLIRQLNVKTTQDLYQTDAPELNSQETKEHSDSDNMTE